MSIKFSELLAMINSLSTAPSTMDRGNGLETRPGIEPLERGCNPKPLHTSGTLAIHDGEEVSAYITDFS